MSVGRASSELSQPVLGGECQPPLSGLKEVSIRQFVFFSLYVYVFLK